MNRKKKS
jgi:hypothetical protein